MDVYGRICESQLLAAFKHLLHGLGSKRRPGAVFNEAYEAVLIIALCQMLDKFAHEWEYVCVVGRGGEDQLAVTECIRYCA